MELSIPSWPCAQMYLAAAPTLVTLTLLDVPSVPQLCTLTLLSTHTGAGHGRCDTSRGWPLLECTLCGSVCSGWMESD